MTGCGASGRHGVADLVDRCFARARRCADLPSAARGVAILDDVAISAAAMLRVYRQLAPGVR